MDPCIGGLREAEDLHGALARVEAEAERMIAIARDIIPAYLAGTPPPPADDVTTRALLIDFLAGFAVFARDGAVRSRKEVARWKGNERSKKRRALPR